MMVLTVSRYVCMVAGSEKKSSCSVKPFHASISSAPPVKFQLFTRGRMACRCQDMMVT